MRTGKRVAESLSAVAVAAALSAGPVAAADAAGSQWSGWDPGTVVEFNLLRGRITQPLPFDVPFYLLTPPRDPVAPGADPIALVAQHDRSANQSACVLNAEANDCRSYPDALCRAPVAVVMEQVMGKGDPKQQLEISIPPLEPRKDYCLLLVSPREPTPAEQNAMTAAAEAVVRQALDRAADPSSIFSSAVMAQLCADVRKSIEKAVAQNPETVAIPKRTSPLVACESDGLPEAIRSALVSAAARANLIQAIGEAEEAIARIRRQILPSESEPLLKELGGLNTPQERIEYLGLPAELPPVFKAADIAAWRNSVHDRREKLAEGWNPTDEERAICNSRSRVESAKPLLGLRCLTTDQLAGIADELESLWEAVPNEQAAVERLVQDAALALASEVAVGATTIATFEDRFRWYVSADLGVAHAWDLNETFGYAGANVYFSPVNKKAPLSSHDFRLPWTRRLAVVIGLPTQDIDAPRVEDIVAGKPLVLGAGVRLTDHLRFTAGALVFDEEDPDPLVNDSAGLAATPFVALSLDVNVASIFSNMLK